MEVGRSLSAAIQTMTHPLTPGLLLPNPPLRGNVGFVLMQPPRGGHDDKRRRHAVCASGKSFSFEDLSPGTRACTVSAAKKETRSASLTGPRSPPAIFYALSPAARHAAPRPAFFSFPWCQTASSSVPQSYCL